MGALGISADDEQVYRQLLRDPKAQVPEAAVRRLAEQGFVSTTADGTLTTVDPQTAVERLVERRLREVDGEAARIRAARASLPSLLAEQTPIDVTEVLERIDGRPATQRRVWETTRDAAEVLAMHRNRPNLASGILERTLRGLERGAVYRTIVRRDMLDDPEIADYLLTIHRAGDRHRIRDADLQPLIIVDRRIAFVPIKPCEPESGALMVRQPGMVAFLVDLFEHTWELSTDLEPAGDRPSDLELAVLEQLMADAKDETAARALGVSVRTLRARVAAVMGRLGAANRFQAGVKARQRGWI